MQIREAEERYCDNKKAIIKMTESIEQKHVCTVSKSQSEIILQNMHALLEVEEVNHTPTPIWRLEMACSVSRWDRHTVECHLNLDTYTYTQTVHRMPAHRNPTCITFHIIKIRTTLRLRPCTTES